MGDENQPAEISGWPKLVITYRTDPDKVAALLPTPAASIETKKGAG